MKLKTTSKKSFQKDSNTNFSDSLIRIGVALLLIAIPLYPKFPIINLPGTYVAIRLEDFLILGVTLLWVFKKLLNRKLSFKYCKNIFKQLCSNKQTQGSKNISRSVLLFWIIGFLSLLSALLITKNILPHIGFFHTLRRVEYMVVFFIMLSTIKSKRDVLFYVEIILLTAFFVFLYAVGQKYLQWPIISTMNQEYSKGLALNIISGGRINSTFAGHYDLAAYTVLILNFCVALIIWVKKWKFRLWIILVTFTTYWLLLMSASRISFAAYLGSVALTLWLLHKKLWIVPVIIVSIIGSSLAPTLFDRYAEVVRYEFAPRFAALKFFETEGSNQIALVPTPTPTPTPIPVIKKGGLVGGVVGKTGPTTPTPTLGPRRLRQVGKAVPVLEDRSTAIRFNAEWPRALRAFYKNPMLGTGYSSITLATDNDYLRLLGEVGLLGFVSFLLIFLNAFAKIKIWLLTKPENFYDTVIIGIAGATIGFLANAMFIDVFEASKIATFYWLLLGLMIGTANVTKKRKST